LVLFVGKLISRKRPQDLVRAVARTPGVQAVFVGEGRLRSQLEGEAGHLGLLGPRPRVHFIGFVNQGGLPRVYSGADVLVVPSGYDPFPVVVMEAMSAGVPAVVSSAVGSIGDLVRPEETGLTFSVGSPESLAQALARLQDNRWLLRVMSSRCRARMTEWGPEQNAEAFAHACLAIAEGRRGIPGVKDSQSRGVGG
jgi:glycosyltransferase involved in cell wall biosynthesis